MTINELVQMAERIHDAERVNLGASSSREQRNAFWARVVGCAYWGHPAYNPTPDRQWHLKDGGGGRPQSDDVVVSLPSRNYWDCIPNAGVDGYRFEAASHTDTLPQIQNVYAPPKPAGGSGTVAPVVVPAPVAVPVYPDETTFWKAFQERMRKAYSDAGRTFPDPNDADAFRRFSRCGFDIGRGVDALQAADKHIAELRKDLGV